MRRASVLLGLCVLVATAVGAQEPPRPRLAVGVDPHHWEGYFDYGVKMFRADPTEALAAFYWASRLDPSRAEPYFARWAALIHRSKREVIRDYFRGVEATLRSPAIVTADSLRALALVRNPFVHRGLEVVIFDELPGNFSDDRDTRAWIAYSNGEFAKAIQLLGTSIERGGPKKVWLRYDRATAAVMAGDPKLALEDLRTLVDELRKGEERETVTFYRSKHLLLYMIGLLHRELRDPAAARAAFGESLVEDAAFAYASAALATVSRAQRQFENAATEYAWAIEISPADGHLRYLYALVLHDLKRFGEAATELERATALEPWYAAPWLLLGRVREAQGREAGAFSAYERFMELAPARDPARVNLKVRIDARARSSP